MLPDFPQSPLLGKPKRSNRAALEYNFSLSSGNFVDEYNVLGFRNEGALRLPEPPMFNEFSALVFEEGEQTFCKIVKPVPEDLNQVVTWNLSARTTRVNKEHTLKWESTTDGFENLQVYLVDLENEKMINLKEVSEYSFTPSKKEHAFRVYISGQENFKPTIVPLHFKLSQNFPNPFNPITTIRVGIPEQSAQERVVLRIFDVLGKEVKRLQDGPLPAGYHKFTWDATNSTGHRVSSGIYFYQLQAGKTMLMKKMVLLR